MHGANKAADMPPSDRSPNELLMHHSCLQCLEIRHRAVTDTEAQKLAIDECEMRMRSCVKRSMILCMHTGGALDRLGCLGLQLVQTVQEEAAFILQRPQGSQTV